MSSNSRPPATSNYQDTPSNEGEGTGTQYNFDKVSNICSFQEKLPHPKLSDQAIKCLQLNTICLPMSYRITK